MVSPQRVLHSHVLHETNEGDMANMPVSSRVQKHRDALRAAGLRLVQIWVPDSRRPGFADECRRQCLVVAQADRADAELQHGMDQVASDTDGWTA